ncbi:MAG: catalase family peroxidase [Solirubrobacterales bacterium]|nr:catalase family peroxidase [Solirubrobacterales bacterium]
MATIWEEIVDSLNAIHGSHPGLRAAHARGTVCTGSFTATREAAALSTAAHLSGDAVPVTVRFSNASGNPRTSDADPIAGRGMSVKFELPRGESTDIVCVPLKVFMVRTAADFLAFTRARAPDPETGQPDPEKLGAFVAEHPETVAAIEASLPQIAPTTSYATSDYNGLHAFALVDAAGERHWGRYSWVPEGGVEFLTSEQVAAADEDYLQAEIVERIARGPVRFSLKFTLAAEGDPLDDPTAFWEGNRELVTLGTLEVTEISGDPDDASLITDPVNLTEGIEPSDDEILEARSRAYSVSIERRMR